MTDETAAPDATPAAWESPKAAPPLETNSTLTFSGVAGHSGEPDVDVAYRWSRIYANDVEYRDFWNWAKDRSNPERTDFRDILNALPLHWTPEQLPPPLRRYFTNKMLADSAP